MSSSFLPSPRATPTSSDRVIPSSLSTILSFDSSAVNPEGKENVAPPFLFTSLGHCPLTPPSSSPIKAAFTSTSPVHQLQLRVPRVVFSQTNRHHPYAHKPRSLLSSKMIKLPSKSILKRLPTGTSSTPSIYDTPTREATPEPEHPLMCAEFLKTPINALVASLSMAEHTIGMEQLFKPSQHDLTEA
ncbi:hypothetical protein FRB95_006041, partial [Tulasnella sp. JGI-2019a]